MTGQSEAEKYRKQCEALQRLLADPKTSAQDKEELREELGHIGMMGAITRILEN